MKTNKLFTLTRQRCMQLTASSMIIITVSVQTLFEVHTLSFFIFTICFKINWGYVFAQNMHLEKRFMHSLPATDLNSIPSRSAVCLSEYCVWITPSSKVHFQRRPRLQLLALQRCQELSQDQEHWKQHQYHPTRSSGIKPHPDTTIQQHTATRRCSHFTTTIQQVSRKW